MSPGALSSRGDAPGPHIFRNTCYIDPTLGLLVNPFCVLVTIAVKFFKTVMDDIRVFDQIDEDLFLASEMLID